MAQTEVEAGVYGAIHDIMDAAAHFPRTRQDIINAVEQGTYRAVKEYLDEHGLQENSNA